MSFDLHVTICGLCCFARDTANGKMHILMPVTPGPLATYKPGCALPPPGMQTHFPRLMYDKAYEGVAPMQFSRVYACHDLEGQTIDFPTIGTPALDLFCPDELVNLTALTGQKVVAAAISLPSAQTSARMSFSDGSISDYSLGLCFGINGTVGNHNGPMTTNIRWTVRGVAATQLTGLGGTIGAAIPALSPIRGAINLYLFHIPDDEFLRTRWPIPTYGPNSSPHFMHYHQLFGVPHGPMPVYSGARPVHGIVDGAGVPHLTVPVDPATFGCQEPTKAVESLTGTCMSVCGDC